MSARVRIGRSDTGLAAAAPAAVAILLVCLVFDPAPAGSEHHASIPAASISAPRGEGGDDTAILFPAAIAETETEISFGPCESDAAGFCCPPPGDDSGRRGHVAATTVDPGVLSANAADLSRLCRRLL